MGHSTRIIIVGAGPAGCYTGYLLARRGFSVTILEEHREVGKPIQCTGIVTAELERFKELAREVQEATINRIRRARIFSPEGNGVTFRLQRENLILDRGRFDALLASKAKQEGVRILMRHKVERIFSHRLKVRSPDGVTGIDADYIIGADGAQSVVRQHINALKTVRYLTGMQARVRMQAGNRVRFYPSVASFAWVVPEDEEHARVGVAGRGNISQEFYRFMGRFAESSEVIEYQGGQIPLYTPSLRCQRDHFYLVGDAATQVKATTGGGLVPGLLAAECCARAIRTGERYERLWRKKLGRDLLGHLLVRRTLDHFSDRDYERLIRLVRRRRVKRCIEQHDREYPMRLLMRLAVTEPRFARFAHRLFF